MDGLLRNCGDALRCGCEGLVNARARCSTDYVVAVKRGVECNGGEKIFVELGTESAQFIDGEIAQLDAFLQSEADGSADFLVRGAEGNALVDEIGCGGHGIEITGLRGLSHALAIEVNGSGEARDKCQHGRHKLDGERRLLS